MKRMTLLTALALVFSLFTVTAAIAGPGPGAGEGEQTGDMVMTQATTRTQTQTQVGECAEAGDLPSDCEPTQTQTRTTTRTQAQTQTQVGECEAGDCPAVDALQAQNQIQERLMNRILEMLGAEGAADEGEYRLFLNLMLQNMLRFRVLFI